MSENECQRGWGWEWQGEKVGAVVTEARRGTLGYEARHLLHMWGILLNLCKMELVQYKILTVSLYVPN